MNPTRNSRFLSTEKLVPGDLIFLGLRCGLLIFFSLPSLVAGSGLFAIWDVVGFRLLIFPAPPATNHLSFPLYRGPVSVRLFFSGRTLVLCCGHFFPLLVWPLPPAGFFRVRLSRLALFRPLLGVLFALFHLAASHDRVPERGGDVVSGWPVGLSFWEQRNFSA